MLTLDEINVTNPFSLRYLINGKSISSNVDLFLNAAQAEDASVLVGKQENFGTYNDICLFYVPFDYEDKSLDRSIISRKRFTE